jgi:hypothetical protein
MIEVTVWGGRGGGTPTSARTLNLHAHAQTYACTSCVFGGGGGVLGGV